jgi:acyl-CoA thioester hydrolase
MTTIPRLEDYPARTTEKVRYVDTDRQGHVNNAIFVSLLEAGRVEILYNPDRPLCGPGQSFVIAHLSLDFRGEINWPGELQIGTRVSRIGRSSVTFDQCMFQDDRCVATAETIVVMTDESTRRSHPLGEWAIAELENLKVES